MHRRHTAAAVLLISSILTFLIMPVDLLAREPRKEPVRVKTEWSARDYAGDLYEILGVRSAPATVDTFCIVKYDFETLDWQGWTSEHYTQPDTFWHVDDFSGLGGGTFGRLTPIEGLKSAWCGARPGDDFYMCSWYDAPGYGGNWEQYFVTDPIPLSGEVTISFHGVFDSEEGFDKTTLEYSNHFLNPWAELAVFDGVADTIVTTVFHPNTANTKIRFRFRSDGAWDDEDGLHITDGAAIIDSVSIHDGSGLVDFEDFESYDAGSIDAGIWHGDIPETFGTYANLRTHLMDSDPCNENTGTMIVFWDETCMPSLEYPGHYVTPFCKSTQDGLDEFCQDEWVISPIIDMRKYSTGQNEFQDADISSGDLEDLGGITLNFTVYRDLPINNLVFYSWQVRNFRDGCPWSWGDRSIAYGGARDDYLFSENRIDDLVPEDSIQVMLYVMDMTKVWFDSYGDGSEHTTSPYFDNVEVLRFRTNGPQFNYRAIDLFQDNFPSEEWDIESWVRADMANDLRSNSDPVIDPGDSIVIGCTSPLGGGIAEDAGGPRVYMHVKCEYIGADDFKGDIAGPSLEGNYGTYVSDDGTWTIIQGDSARIGTSWKSRDRFMFDLNDSLLTRGYMVEYYFKAYDVAGESATLPADAETVGDYYLDNGTYLFEFTCLPTLNTGQLYVDDFDGIGYHLGVAQVYWDDIFRDYYASPDRYDVLGPSSLVSNGPGSRAKLYHMISAYEDVYWDSGDLSAGTISEGTDHSDKSNDCQLLIDWLHLSEHKVALWVMGDGIASDLDAAPSASALALMSTYCGVRLGSSSYYELTGGYLSGGTVTPQVTGVSGGPYDGISYYAFGGCPVVNSFDVLERVGAGEYSLRLPDHESEDYYIGITSHWVNSFGSSARTSWIGHSMMAVRDGEAGNVRDWIYNETMQFFEHAVNTDIVNSEVPAISSLAQNYPNPFNPSTTVSFGLARNGYVDLKIYNVAGQLVRTLISGELDAGLYKEIWDGRSETGSPVASGIYFYRMQAPGFEQSRKMVLLR